MTVDLSVVIPCYNETAKIERDVDAALSYFRTQQYSFELVLVDDGSSDGTAALLRTLESRHAPQVRAICYRPTRGKGRAVKTGMLQAAGKRRLFADAGLCVPFSETEQALRLIGAGSDVVIGSRKLAASRVVERQAPYRRLGSKVFGWLVRNAMGLRHSDTQCGFKMFTAAAAARLFGMSRIDGFMFDAETLINARKLGYTVREFPVEWRADPDSRYKPFSGSIRNLIELLRIRFQ